MKVSFPLRKPIIYMTRDFKFVTDIEYGDEFEFSNGILYQGESKLCYFNNKLFWSEFNKPLIFDYFRMFTTEIDGKTYYLSYSDKGLVLDDNPEFVKNITIELVKYVLKINYIEEYNDYEQNTEETEYFDGLAPIYNFSNNYSIINDIMNVSSEDFSDWFLNQVLVDEMKYIVQILPDGPKEKTGNIYRLFLDIYQLPYSYDDEFGNMYVYEFWENNLNAYREKFLKTGRDVTPSNFVNFIFEWFIRTFRITMANKNL